LNSDEYFGLPDTLSRSFPDKHPNGRLSGNGGAPQGWQITLIALGAALVAATAAVILDRTLAARRAATAA
jgi:hypothetical protein